MSSDSFMQRTTKKNIFTISLINARCLRPKLNSLKETLDELGADVCLLTETWLKNTDEINQTFEDFTNQTGYCFLRKDRRGDRRGGGVAVCYNQNLISFTKAKIPPSKHEVYAAIGRRVGQRRKVGFFLMAPSFEAGEAHQYLKNRLGIVRARG